MKKTSENGVFPRRCEKCFYKSKHGDYCYIKPRAIHCCATFSKRT